MRKAKQCPEGVTSSPMVQCIPISKRTVSEDIDFAVQWYLDKAMSMTDSMPMTAYLDSLKRSLERIKQRVESPKLPRFTNSVAFKMDGRLRNGEEFVQVGDASWGYWCLVPVASNEDRSRLKYILDALNFYDQYKP